VREVREDSGYMVYDYLGDALDRLPKVP